MSDKPARQVITDADLALFTAKVREFADKAGLHEWEIYVEREKLRDGADGECWEIYAQKKAIITISTSIHWLNTIEHIAAHEVAELMLAQLDYMSKVSYAASHVDEYRHEAVNHIVRLLLAK